MGPTFEEQPDYESGSFFTAVLNPFRLAHEQQELTVHCPPGEHKHTWWFPVGSALTLSEGEAAHTSYLQLWLQKANSRSTTQISAQLLVRSHILYIHTWELILSDPSANSPDIKQTSCQFKCYTENLQLFVKWVTATEPQRWCVQSSSVSNALLPLTQSTRHTHSVGTPRSSLPRSLITAHSHPHKPR